MTPTQTTLLTHALTAIIGAAIIYAILTANNPTPEAVAIKAIQAEERIRLRAEGAGFVRDSLRAVESRISERPAQRGKVNKKWAEIARERANVTDSVAGVELINRIETWKP
jgi:hypothetical protein